MDLLVGQNLPLGSPAHRPLIITGRKVMEITLEFISGEKKVNG